MKLFEKPIVMIDFETTGLSPEQGDRITEVAALRIVGGCVVDRYVSLINCQVRIPSFITGPFLVAVFALWLRWLPVGGWGGISHLILPAICLSAPYVAYVARLMRNSLLDVMKSDFLRTAKAKGLTETQALTRHAMKVAILPVVTYLGPLAAHLLTGSMIVESVFNISGAGSIFVNAIQNRDAFLLCGAVVIYCSLLIVFNFIVDLLYSVLDKRIRLYA